MDTIPSRYDYTVHSLVQTSLQPVAYRLDFVVVPSNVFEPLPHSVSDASSSCIPPCDVRASPDSDTMESTVQEGKGRC